MYTLLVSHKPSAQSIEPLARSSLVNGDTAPPDCLKSGVGYEGALEPCKNNWSLLMSGSI